MATRQFRLSDEQATKPLPVFNQKNRMGYLIDFEHELRDLLAAGDIEATVSYAKKKLLESYYNTAFQ